MADELIDPREVPWHPRLTPNLFGHQAAELRFLEAFASGRPHHAWLITGPSGVGKATLAYRIARHVLGQGGHESQAARWIASRAHPDIAVLERGFTETKPKRLRAEIGVDEARAFIDFFARTSSGGGWRVGLVDCADDLTTEAANALLKLVEEPPDKALILITCNAPGRILRTLRSRCMRMPLEQLNAADTLSALNALPLEPRPDQTLLLQAAGLSNGRPGRALQLLNSEGAKAFDAYRKASRRDGGLRVAVGGRFSTRAAAAGDYDIFMELLMEWLAMEAASQAGQRRGAALAEVHAKLAQAEAITTGYNLDRRIAVMEVLRLVDDALKAA